jgi:predicted GNAT superfamily acetyltransferase
LSQLAAREIFDSVWEIKFGSEIASNLLHAMIHSGSYLSGALIGDQLVGAAFAFPATNDG